MRTEDKVQSYMQQHNMMEKEDHVVVGLSGGADSVCLLYLLYALKDCMNIQITAVHIEHGIRGKEALRDAAFVEQVCDNLGITCITRHYNVPAMARQAGMSEEEMGRMLRYEAFEEVADEIGANRIAVAHHKQDVVETMLFNLCRGTGLAGLCTMSPVRGRIIRPLLCLDRNEIEDYLKKKEIGYCIDSTNAESEYSRNYIRNEILPRLEQVNTKAVEHFFKTWEVLGKANDVLEAKTEALKEAYIVKKREGLLIRRDLFEEHEVYLVTGVLQNVIGEMAGSKKDITGTHMQKLLQLDSMQTGRGIDLPYGLRATREYEGIFIEREAKSELPEEWQVEAMIPGVTKLPDGTEVETRIIPVVDTEKIFDKIPDKKYTKWFDYDIINEHISFRYKRPQDVMVVTADGGTKKIKELFINEKVPRQERERILLAVSDETILWAIGVRMGEFGKVTSTTRRILEITIRGGQGNE